MLRYGMTAKTWDELYGPDADKDKTALEASTEPEDSELLGMSQEALIALVRRCNGWQMAIKDRDGIAEAFKLKLAMSGFAEKDMFKALPIMREWFDREMGKAAQSVSMKVEVNALDRMETEKLLRLAAMMDDPMIIAPMPVKLG